MAEYTQRYVQGVGSFAPAPAGLTPSGADMPDIIPTGLVPVQQPRRGKAQYAQRVDESVWVGKPSLVPGLRGSARRLPHYIDPLVEPPVGPIYQTNGGFLFNMRFNRVRSFKPSQEFQSVYVNGKWVPPPKFKARPIGEINARECI